GGASCSLLLSLDFPPSLRGQDSSHERTSHVRQRHPSRGGSASQSLSPSPRDRMTTEFATAEGVLELHPRGYGFLRSAQRSYVPGQADVYVPEPLIRKLALREGVQLAGPVEPPRKGAGPRLERVETVEGRPAEQFRPRTFDDLTPIDPHVQLMLETGAQPLTTRVMDLLTPIGKGTRGLLVAPPRTGKTVLLQHVAQAVSTNHPEMELIMLLIDERPEEVTEMRRTLPRAEVIASSSDPHSSNHVRVAELAVE